MKTFFLSVCLTMACGLTTFATSPDSTATVRRTPAENRREAKACSEQIKHNPRDGAAYRRRADAEVRLKNYREAVADYTKAIQLKAGNADAYYNRGMAQIQLEQYKKAVADFTAAVRLRPDDAGALYGRGVARVMLFDYKTAITDFNKALVVDEKMADAYEYRGIAYASLDKSDEACQDLAQAVNLNPNAAKSQRQYCKGCKTCVAVK